MFCLNSKDRYNEKPNTCVCCQVESFLLVEARKKWKWINIYMYILDIFRRGLCQDMRLFLAEL